MIQVLQQISCHRDHHSWCRGIVKSPKLFASSQTRQIIPAHFCALNSAYSTSNVVWEKHNSLLEGGGASTPDYLLTIQSVLAHLRLSHVNESMTASSEGANLQWHIWTCNTQTDTHMWTLHCNFSATCKNEWTHYIIWCTLMHAHTSLEVRWAPPLSTSRGTPWLNLNMTIFATDT